MLDTRTSKRLQLKKETIGVLTEEELSNVNGGTSFGSGIIISTIALSIGLSCSVCD